MNLLTRNTDYAVRALLYMTERSGAFVSTAELDRHLKLPRPFMRKTLRVLQKQGYLLSVKGHKGGFRLGVPPNKIRLIDLMEAFQGNISFGDCLFKKKFCDCMRSCVLRREIKAMEAVFLRRLKTITVGSLSAQGGS